MTSDNAHIIEREGNRKFVMLPYEEYLQLREAEKDCEELKAFRKAKELREESPWSGASEYVSPRRSSVQPHDVSSLARRWLEQVQRG